MMHSADEPQPKGNHQRIETTQWMQSRFYQLGCFYPLEIFFAFLATISL